MLHCYCPVTCYYNAALPLITLLGHSCCFSATVMMQSCSQPVSYYFTTAMLLAIVASLFPLSCYIANGTPLHFHHAICHCHAALSVRLIASIMLLFGALSHCLTLSGYLAATCYFDSVILLCWCHAALPLSY